MNLGDRTPVTSGRAAPAAAPLHPLLGERWSPRAFDARHRLAREQVIALLEAARWAPSASNSQPWRFLVAHRGTAEHAAVLETLAPGNRSWAGAASALLVVAAVTETAAGAALPWSSYDTGQAVAHLSVQAQHEGLAVHQLGGFDAERLHGSLDVGPEIRPLVVVAVGRHDPRAALAEPLAARETAPRVRQPLDQLLMEVRRTAAVA
jgi:nitroreductase